MGDIFLCDANMFEQFPRRVRRTGNTGDALMSLLERRLDNNGSDELQVAAAEQRKITSLRLEKLIMESA